jgi:GDPmannose 4,6-dehydratase
MKAIIFGVTGQDGSHLAEFLLDHGYEVVGVARRSSTDTTERLGLSKLNARFKLVEGDITDAHSVRNVLSENADVDEVYNLAAQSHVSVSFKQPALTWDITGKGCLNILQTIVDLGLKCKFYQASSSEMFGASYDVNQHGTKYQDENTKFMPQSPYAIAKCAAHYMTRLFREAYGVHASAGILFNHEGERRGETFVTRKITKWIGKFYRWVDQNKVYYDGIKDCNQTDCIIFDNFHFPKLRLGNLDAYRDWGYAGDYVEAMWLMLQQQNPDDYVICTGETHTIREFLDHAFGSIGVYDWSKFVTIDPEFYRPAEVEYLRGRNYKAVNKLGWKPKHSFKELVELMVEYDINENL